MSAGKRSIRTKIFLLLLLPLLSLSALWGFVLNLTVGDGIALLRSNTIYQSAGVTSTDLGLQIQAERSISAAVLSTKFDDQNRLATQRHTTDMSLAKFRAAAMAEDTQGALNDLTKTAITSLLDELEHLPSIRASVDTAQSSRLDVTQSYNRIMDALFAVYTRMASVPDLTMFEQASAMQAMGNAREIIARENALVTGALASGGLTHPEYSAFAEWAANRRFQYAKGMAALDDELRKPYEEVFASPTFKRFAAMERDLTGKIHTGGPLPDTLGRWKPITDNLSSMLDQVNVKATQTLAERGKSIATGILLRIVVAGGLGLVAVIASIVISVRFGRRLVRELADLRNSARELADVRLPRVVDRLRRGEAVDVDTEAPPIVGGNSLEVSDVANAFSSVQRTAVEAAVGQANLRQGVSLVFLNLARRKQGLLHRQLTLLDAMQRRAREPDALEDLFQLDHLTTRMRRHAESLIILSGAAPGRAWRKPVPMVDVVRAAVAEVEDYTRVKVFPLPGTHISGTVVADLIHLIAELVENATIFSPPQTTVQVRGDEVANGFVVEIEDRGLGLNHDEYEAVNDRLANPPEFDLADSDRLGLFVVGQLAARHNVSVVLRGSPYGGTTAIVLIPKHLVADPAAPIPGAPVESSPQHAKEPLTGRTSRPAALTSGQQAAEPATDTSAYFTPPSSRSQDRPADATPPSLTVVPGIADTGPIDLPTDAAPRAGGGEGSPSAPPRTSTANGTHRGLPRRVRQTNMAPQLRETTGPLAAPTPASSPYDAAGSGGPGVAERSPDEARAMFSAFQQGGRRGRLDAERDSSGEPQGSEDRPDEPASRGDGENRLPRRTSGRDRRTSGESGDGDQKRELRNHSEGYVQQTTGEKGDE
ncbi:sensor histidine kinase [Sphaerisporangium perillae]|uniref:sensor histidine kinase n=1 Tax=Sphaerisporangium perillae TaxID=2935860 RepID=UPI0020104FE3|nr:nitrate- and nitrite sensing domain-containing protein [Sphaerisporangium perillae]